MLQENLVAGIWISSAGLILAVILLVKQLKNYRSAIITFLSMIYIGLWLFFATIFLFSK